MKPPYPCLLALLLLGVSSQLNASAPGVIQIVALDCSADSGKVPNAQISPLASININWSRKTDSIWNARVELPQGQYRLLVSTAHCFAVIHAAVLSGHERTVVAVVQNKTIQSGHWGQSIIGSLPFAGAVVYEQLSPRVRRDAVVEGTAFYFDGVESGEQTLVVSYASFISKIVVRVKPGTLLVRNLDSDELYRTIGVEYGQPSRVLPLLVNGTFKPPGHM